MLAALAFFAANSWMWGLPILPRAGSRILETGGN